MAMASSIVCIFEVLDTEMDEMWITWSDVYGHVTVICRTRSGADLLSRSWFLLDRDIGYLEVPTRDKDFVEIRPSGPSPQNEYGDEDEEEPVFLEKCS